VPLRIEGWGAQGKAVGGVRCSVARGAKREADSSSLLAPRNDKLKGVALGHE
jgi:hypothetical protein